MRIALLWIGLVTCMGSYGQSLPGMSLLHITPSNTTNSRSALLREANKPSSTNPHFICPKEVNELGYLRAGTSQVFAIEIANNGARHLQIKNMNPATSQVAVLEYDRVIDPMGAGTVKVNVRPQQPGNFTYHITVISNADNFVEVITLRGVAY